MGRDDVYPARTSKVIWLLLQYLVLPMMDTESVRNMYSELAVTNKQYCQSCILLVLYIL